MPLLARYTLGMMDQAATVLTDGSITLFVGLAWDEFGVDH